MDLGLKGKRAIVTGAGRGIGRTTATLLAAEGARVFLVSRTEEQLQEAAAEIVANGGEASFATCDVADTSALAALMEQAVGRLGGLDILVNNAGEALDEDFLELSPERFQSHLQLKLFGAAELMRLAVPHMRNAGGGRIISIGGLSTRQVTAFGQVGGVGNAGLVALSKAMARHLAPEGILINVVHPGATRTDRMRRYAVQIAARRGVDPSAVDMSREAAPPIGRLVEPEEVAAAIVFLASAHAGAITGQTLAVEGGATIGITY